MNENCILTINSIKILLCFPFLILIIATNKKEKNKREKEKKRKYPQSWKLKTFQSSQLYFRKKKQFYILIILL